ncbi:ATP-binding cassette domain-containing protein, partial [Candidatus Poribacteria bacterium]|nr:ATP-binding cassette domain-containing protein [Candidatus Poribacteria bacterium]
MSNPLLEMQSITKDFPGVRALDNVSFDVRHGEIHALCGENGAGKSTLIKILGGVYPHGAYAGALRIDGHAHRFGSVRDAENAGIAIIYQELALIPEMTVGENIYLGREPTRFGMIDRNRLYHDAAHLLSDFSLSLQPQTPVGQLGIGQQQMVEIAKALSREARLLVLDEPTAALTESEVETLMRILRQLREKGISCIYITHKLKEIFVIADRVTVLRDGKTVGTFPIEKCDEGELISRMVGRELTDFFPKREGKIGGGALRVQNLNAYHPQRPDQQVLRGITFEVRQGEILGIAGLMGAGRTELINAIFGAYPGRCTGEIFVDGVSIQIRSPHDAIRYGMGLVSEDRKRYGLLPDADVARNMTLASLNRLGAERIARYGIINRNEELRQSRRYVESLQIKTPSLETPINHLSGGNQQKVVLGKWLMTQPKILFLD